MKYLLYYFETQPFEETEEFEFVDTEERYIVEDLCNTDKSPYSSYYLTFYNNELKVRNISFSYNVSYDILKEDIKDADKLFKRYYNVKPIFLFGPIERKKEELYIDCFYENDISKYLFGLSKTRDPYFCITEYSVYIHNEMKNFDIKDKVINLIEERTLCYSFDKNYSNNDYLVISVETEKDIRNDLLYRNKNFIEDDYFEFRDNKLIKHKISKGFKISGSESERKTYVFSFDNARLDKNLYESETEDCFKYIDVETEEDILDFIFYYPNVECFCEFYVINRFEARVHHTFFPYNFYKKTFLSDLSMEVLLSSIGECFLNEDIANAFV